MFVKPVKGRSVPDPARGDLLPAEGRNVDENNYWLRREAAGDIRRVNKKVNTDDDKLYHHSVEYAGSAVLCGNG